VLLLPQEVSRVKLYKRKQTVFINTRIGLILTFLSYKIWSLKAMKHMIRQLINCFVHYPLTYVNMEVGFERPQLEVVVVHIAVDPLLQRAGYPLLPVVDKTQLL